jgi:3-oxoacyl-(acyl-carrier-protein) synthase
MIAVTGIGVLAPHAEGRDAFARLLAGEPPRPESLTIEGRAFSLLRTADPVSVPVREARRLTRPALFTLAASREALGGASFPPEATGFALGTGFGSIEATRLTLEALFERADHVSPTQFVGSVRHDAASAAARLLSFRGPSVAASARRLSFEQALGWAIRQLRSGRARAMLAAGADEVTPLLLRALGRGRLRGEKWTQGEGAAALLLERESEARDAGRPVLARIGGVVEGVGSVDDQARAIERAFEQPSDLLVAESDLAARLLTRGLGAKAPPAVSETTGQLAAGGAFAAVASVLAVSGAIDAPAWRGRTALVAAREADDSFFAYTVAAGTP